MAEVKGQVRILGQEGSITLWQPRIEVTVAGINQDFRTVEAVVDTGFTGALAFPASIIRELGLTHYGDRTVNLADGQKPLPIYGALIHWLGQLRAAPVYQIDGNPLAGNALLTGCRLTVDFRDGGSVAVAPLEPGGTA